MTVAQLIEALARMPSDAVVLMEGDGGLSLVTDLDFIENTEFCGSRRSDPASEYE